MIEWIVTFLSVFFVDVFYTFYLQSVEEEKELKASLWAVIVFIIAATAVINYIDNHTMLIPAALGAFCGTFAGIKIRKKLRS